AEPGQWHRKSDMAVAAPGAMQIGAVAVGWCLKPAIAVADQCHGDTLAGRQRIPRPAGEPIAGASFEQAERRGAIGSLPALPGSGKRQNHDRSGLREEVLAIDILPRTADLQPLRRTP